MSWLHCSCGAVADLDLQAVPSLKNKDFVAISKHLCGAATGTPSLQHYTPMPTRPTACNPS